MGDVGATILVERKFSIYSQFLDTVLQSEGVIEEGETRKDALLRVHRELEETANELRKNIGSVNAISQWQNQEYKQEVVSTYASAGPLIIDKSFERLEIAIDNATTHAELNRIKEENQFFPAKLLDAFNKKRREIIDEQLNDD